VALFGDLGAGKTTLTKGIASAFDIPEDEITSASFTLISMHEGSVPLCHVDLYRLSSQSSAEIGLEDYFDSSGVVVIEWPDRYVDYLPDDRIEVIIRFSREGRSFEILSARKLSLEPSAT